MPARQAPAAATTPENALGLHPGETMAFEVQLAGVLVGEAQLAVGEVGDVDGKPALVVRSRAATAGAAALLRKVSDEATTVIDVATGRPVSVDTLVEMGAKRIAAGTKFGATSAEVTYTILTGAAPAATPAKPNKFTVQYKGQILHDAHTAMAQLRGWKATPGTMRTVYVIGGRRLWRVDVTYAGEETIGTSLGNRRAVIFDGVSYRAGRDLKPQSNKPARKFRVWLSDDADRVPLKVVARTELGEVAMALTDYARP